MNIFRKRNILAVVILLLIPLLPISIWRILLSQTNIDLSQFLDVTVDKYREIFGLPPIVDPEEKEKKAETLKEHQQAVRENNEAYQAGERTWFEGINEFSDTPDDEFIATHTGLIGDPQQFNNETRSVLEESLMSEVPASYDSVSLGHVSPVKNQGGCGSCVAFATLALVETCFKKRVGIFGDYSEQHLLDCAYGARGVYGCRGAWPSGYTSWLTENKSKLASEETYPYTARVGTCRTDYEEFDQGAKISGSDNSGWGRGNEESLKALVYQHGAVMVAVAANGNFSRYRGGIFAGCSESDRINHAVVVVGYGSEVSEVALDYWLVKNSWGTGWGDQGYMKIMRGVNMCGIGTSQTVIFCEAREEEEEEEENNIDSVRPRPIMLMLICWWMVCRR